jgi:ubiquinone biosynthesis O-methyltransferase
VPDEIRDYFDEAAVDRNAKIARNLIVDYEQVTRSRMLFSMLAPEPGELVLDGGCGNARDLIELARMGCSGVGIDYSPNMVEEARAALAEHGLTDVTVEVGDLTDLRFADEEFDKVYASEVLEHIPDYQKAVSELARVLKPGGTAVVTTPNRHSLYGFDHYVILEKVLRWDPDHPYDEWKTHSELASALKTSGLEIEQSAGACYIPGSLVSYNLPDFLKRPLVGAVRGLEPWLSRTFPKSAYMLAIKAVKR